MIDAPLRETFLLLAGMAVLALPLFWVTADEVRARPPSPASSSPLEEVRTDIEVECAHPLEWLELVRQSDGQLLGRIEGPFTFGEIEGKLLTSPQGGGLLVSAQWSSGVARSALRIELLPDGLPPVSKTFWGQGQLEQTWEVSFDE